MTHLLIIGGSSGTGKQLALSARSQYTHVSVVGRRKNPFSHNNISYHVCDVSKKTAVAKMLAGVTKTHGKITHVAFFHRLTGLSKTFADELDVSVRATHDLFEHLAKHMASSGDRSVCVMSSLSSQFIAKNQGPAYHVAKAALDQLVRYYAVAWGKKGIRVNGVSSGTIIKPETKLFYVLHQPRTARLKRASPLKRVCSAQDIVHTFLFLLSTHSSFITGQTIVVDGGASLVMHESIC